MSILGLILLPVAAATISWSASTDGTNGIWSFSCDFFGQDLASAVVPGDQCGGKCKATAGCTHFTWTTYNGGTCWMKSGPAFRTDAFDKNDNSMVCGLLPTWSNNWANGCDFNVQANNLANALTTADQCGAKCTNTAGCTHFTWTTYNTGTCWMKKNTPTGLIATTDVSMVCGVKSGSAPPPPPPPSGGRTIKVRNACQQPIWMQTAVRGVDLGTKKVDIGAVVTYSVPSTGWEAVMMWPKTGCDATGNNCLFGQSRPPCPSDGCTPPAETKAEFTIFPEGDRRPTYWDISLVDGFSLPMTITPNETPSGTCIPTRFALDLSKCPANEIHAGDLRRNGRDGRLAACLSPCKKYTTPQPIGLGNSEQTTIGQQFCCPHPPMDTNSCAAGAVMQTQFVNLIHQSSPSGVYTYAFDDRVGTHICSSSASYEIQIC